MIGLICWEKLGHFKVKGKKIYLGGVPLFRIELEEGGRFFPYRLRKLKRLLEQEKIHRVITSDEFEYFEYIDSVREYSPLSALQSLGGDITLDRLEKRNIAPSSATVTLVGKEVTEIYESIAFEIAPLVKEVILNVEKGGEVLGEALYRRYGLAPCYGMKKTTATVYFSPQKERGKEISLNLYQENSLDFQGIILKNVEIPEDIPYLSMVGLLIQCGKVQKKDIDFT